MIERKRERERKKGMKDSGAPDSDNANFVMLNVPENLLLI